jgi:hypothetical protein
VDQLSADALPAGVRLHIEVSEPPDVRIRCVRIGRNAPERDESVAGRSADESRVRCIECRAASGEVVKEARDKAEALGVGFGRERLEIGEIGEDENADEHQLLNEEPRGTECQDSHS